MPGRWTSRRRGQQTPGMPNTRRLLAVLVVLAAAVLGAAQPAAAQYPGANGEKTYNNDNDVMVPCMASYYGDGPYDRFLNGGIAWAADGNRVALTVDAREPVAPASFTELITLTTSPCTTPRSLGPVDTGSRASFSPDGKQVAVQRGGDIWIVEVATGRSRNLTPNLASTAETNPSWSPKGTAIAYESSDGIRTRPPAGGASTLWKKGALDYPDYSPDGTKIAYIEGTRIRYAASVGGTGVVTTPISPEPTYFTWSPDGKFFFFTSGVNSSNCVVATLTGKIVERVGWQSFCAAASWQPRR